MHHREEKHVLKGHGDSENTCIINWFKNTSMQCSHHRCGSFDSLSGDESCPFLLNIMPFLLLFNNKMDCLWLSNKSFCSASPRKHLWHWLCGSTWMPLDLCTAWVQLNLCHRESTGDCASVMYMIMGIGWGHCLLIERLRCHLVWSPNTHTAKLKGHLLLDFLEECRLFVTLVSIPE